MRRTVAVIAIVGVLGACGSDGGGTTHGASKEYVDAMMRSYDSSDAKDVLTQKEMRCVAEGVVAAIGAGKLKDTGVTIEDVGKVDSNPFRPIGKKLSESEIEAVVSVITGGDCFNFTDLVIKQASSGSSNPFEGVPEKKVRCLFDKLLDGTTFKDDMANSFLGRGGDDAFAKAFGDPSTIVPVMSACDLSASELPGT